MYPKINNATVCGTVAQEPVSRVNKEGKSFYTFPVNVSIPEKNGGGGKILLIDAIVDGDDGKDKIMPNWRVFLKGNIVAKKRDGILRPTLYVENTDLTSGKDRSDGIMGEMNFLGKVGKDIRMHTDKRGKQYLTYSGYTYEKLQDGTYDNTWVRFISFSAERPAWLEPKVWVNVHGAVTFSVYKGRIELGCRVSSHSKWNWDADNNTSSDASNLITV